MINIILECLMISTVISYTIGYSGFVDEFKQLIWRLINGKQVGYRYFRMKPFDCELCMTFWFTLLYLIIFNNNLNLIYILFISSINSYISPIITRLFGSVFNFLFKKIK